MKQYYSKYDIHESRSRSETCRKYLLPNTAEVLRCNNLQFKNIFRMNKVISVITSLSLSPRLIHFLGEVSAVYLVSVMFGNMVYK